MDVIRAIMTVPQRLHFSAQLSNCNLATCWHVEHSILGLLLHWSIDQIHTTVLLHQLWDELLPWERTPWPWSKHVKFRPSWIMTVPQRLCFSAQLSNCKVATCCLIELSILGLLHISIRIRTKITFSCCMKFFQLKMTLGLALGWFKTRM